jgi:HD superfamily phosphohydrolase
MRNIKIFFDPVYGAFPFKLKPKKKKSIIIDILEKDSEPISENEEVEAEIPFDYEERFYPVFYTFEFQRLNFLNQAGFLWLCGYPSATHNRFAHSLGCWYLGWQALEYVKIKEDIERGKELFLSTWLEKDQLVEEFLLSLLLHDIGHFPFSHVLENNKYYRDISHEQIAVQLIQGEGEFFKSFSEFVSRSYRLSEELTSEPLFLSQLLKMFERVDIDVISAIISKNMNYLEYKNNPKIKDPTIRQKISVMTELVSGLIDLDRIDHYLRDTYFTGLKTAAVSPVALLANMTLVPAPYGDYHQCLIYLTEEGILQAFALLEGRDTLRNYVFDNLQNIAYIAMLNTALELFLDKNPHLVNEVPFWTDGYLLNQLSNSGDERILKLVSRIVTSKPYYFVEEIDVFTPTKREQSWLDELKQTFISYLNVQHGKVVDEADVIIYVPKGFFSKKGMPSDDWLKFDFLYDEVLKMPLTQIDKYQKKIEYFKHSLEKEKNRNFQLQVFAATKEIKEYLEKFILREKHRFK